MLAFLKLFFEILFGGYATPTKCVAFWRLALNSYNIFYFSCTDSKRNRPLHWIPYRLLPDAAGYRLFQIPCSPTVCIFPEHIATATGRIWSAFHLWHLIFDTGIKLLPLRSQFHAGCRNHAQPRHSESQASIIHPQYLCFSASVLCHHTRITSLQKWFALLKLHQGNCQRCHQFFCGKSCHNTADTFLGQCLAQTCSGDGVDMARIQKHIRTSL